MCEPGAGIVQKTVRYVAKYGDTMPILDPIALDITPCRCGRRSDKIHCPNCGSYTKYAIKRQDHRTDPVKGIDVAYQVYRCRGCGIYYNDYQWRNECSAPVYESTRTQRSRQVQLDTRMSPQRAAILKGIENYQRAREEETSKLEVDPLQKLFDRTEPKP